MSANVCAAPSWLSQESLELIQNVGKKVNLKFPWGFSNIVKETNLREFFTFSTNEKIFENQKKR